MERCKGGKQVGVCEQKRGGKKQVKREKGKRKKAGGEVRKGQEGRRKKG